MHGVQDDPAYRTLRGAVNARTTLDAGFTTVRNLGLMVKTGATCSMSHCNVPSSRAGTRAAHLAGRPRGHPTVATSTRRCSSGWRPA